MYLHNLPPNIKNPCRQAANGRVHCDEQNCRKDKNGEQECRSRIHTFQATPNGYISIEEQMAIEEKVSKSQGSNNPAIRTWGPWMARTGP